MFESLAIRASAPLRNRVDLGEIAEALLFYGTIHLFLSEGELTELIQRAGLHTVLALAEAGHSKITVLRGGAATHSVGPIGRETYDFITFHRVRGSDPVREAQEIVVDAFARAGEPSGKSRRAAQRFLRNAGVTGLSDPASDRSSVCDASRADARDGQYLQFAIAESISALTGQPPPPGWLFEVAPNRDGFGVSTNLDFRRLTSLARAKFGTDVTITPALLLDCMHQARVDLQLAASAGSELLTSPLSSQLVGNRLVAALQSSATSRFDEIHLFQSIVLQGHSLGDAVRSGARTLDEVLVLAEKAARFRSWLADRPADSTLLAEFYAEVTRGTWVDRLPGKSVRFAVFTALGLAVDAMIPTGVGTAVGLAVGAVDSFLVDRLVAGWKPSQFVDRDLVSFVRRE